jgi:hypothetical protein
MKQQNVPQVSVNTDVTSRIALRDETCLARCLAQVVQKHPELARLIQSWPELPEHIRAAIKALVQTHKAEKSK